VLCIVVHGNHIYVANCGDSKAKLFRRGEFKGDLSKLIPIKISNLHNAGNFEEQKKLRAKFKNEKDIIVDKNTASYVKGRLQPTKTIGDLFLKHKIFNEPLDILNETTLKYSRKFIPNFSGPYIDHFPEILTFELTENDEFIVLGSDGLWDWLDGFEVAEILDKFCNDKSKVLYELSTKALLRAASKVGMNIEQLEQIPITARRSIYDDISFIVVDLKNQVPKSTNITS
jgi:pyruvate dehydrogenase phosphatase